MQFKNDEITKSDRAKCEGEYYKKHHKVKLIIRACLNSSKPRHRWVSLGKGFYFEDVNVSESH